MKGSDIVFSNPFPTVPFWNFFLSGEKVHPASLGKRLVRTKAQ